MIIVFSHFHCVLLLVNYCVGYNCQQIMNGRKFIVSEQNNSEKPISTATTFWTIQTVWMWYPVCWLKYSWNLLNVKRYSKIQYKIWLNQVFYWKNSTFFLAFLYDDNNGWTSNYMLMVLQLETLPFWKFVTWSVLCCMLYNTIEIYL